MERFIFALSLLFMLALHGEEGDTQQFVPSRYALVSAPVMVKTMTSQSQLFSPASVFRLDTATGQVWMLQVIMQGITNPIIVSAVWVPVIEIPPNQLQNQLRYFQQSVQPYNPFQ